MAVISDVTIDDLMLLNALSATSATLAAIDQATAFLARNPLRLRSTAAVDHAVEKQYKQTAMVGPEKKAAIRKGTFSR